MKQTYRSKAGDHGRRLDIVLTEALGNTRSFWQRHISFGYVTVDGQAVKPKTIVAAGQTVQIDTPKQQLVAPDLPIVFQNDELLIVDKPAGLLVHPTATSNEAAVSHFAALHTSDDDKDRPGIVHRLDRETSGLLILAKTKLAQQYLQSLFKGHLIHKTYVALVVGHLRPEEAVIDLPIGRSLRNPAKRAVNPIGRHARTHYRVLREWPGYSLVELKPETGRTHQLRVHLAHIGHPIIGDTFYGDKRQHLGLTRQFLHAQALNFEDSSGTKVEVASDLPAELQMVLAALDKRYND